MHEELILLQRGGSACPTKASALNDAVEDGKIVMAR